jgi:uncharacterized protein
MGRLILLALVVLAAVWLVRRALREREPPPGPPGDLVACAHCGVHLPAGEARRAEGLPYCSEEHARLGPRRP